MATTTTWTLIRDNYHTKLDAITPTLLSQFLFRRAPTNHRLIDWAPDNGSAAFRRYEFSRDGVVADPLLFDPTALERQEDLVLLVAYPVKVALYGSAELDDLESVIRSDARQLRDVIFSAGNYLAGQSAAFVEIEPTDRRDDRVWFLTLRAELHFLEAQTLT